MLSRTEVLYHSIDLTDIPARQRHEALRLELEQSAPFETVAGWVVWQQGRACVWYWPQELQQRIETQLPGSAAGLRWLPETALWPELAAGSYRWIQDQDSGLNLLQYQHPRHGLAEKRYSRPITAVEAGAWLTRHGFTGDGPPQAADAPGWGPIRGAPLEKPESPLETRLLPLAALSLGFLLLVWGVATVRAGIEASAARERADQLQVGVSDVLLLRQQVNTMQADNAALAAYHHPSQLTTAAVLAELLEIEGGRLVHWSYRNGRLELSWLPEGELPDTTELIATLEDHPAFSQVQAQNRGDSMVELSLRINGQALPGGAQTDE